MRPEKLVSSLRQIERLVALCLAAVDEQPSLAAVKPNKAGEKRRHAPASAEQPNFTLPLRPFANKYARGKSGPEKFALVLAHMTKAKLRVPVNLTTIRKEWGKMTELLEDFNFAYTTRAKNNGWVDSPKKNAYTLLPGWTEILSGKAR